MKKWLLGLGALVGVGAYIASNKELREKILFETKKGKESVDVGLEKIISSLKSLDKIKEMTDDELDDFVEKILNEEEDTPPPLPDGVYNNKGVESDTRADFKTKKDKRKIFIELPKEEDSK